jgi:serine/threonine protein kinase
VTTTVQRVCEQLAAGLLPAAQVRKLYRRWRESSPADQADDVERFARWLIARGYVSMYQALRLLHGHVEHLLVGGYRIVERLGVGDMAKVFKALAPDGTVVALKVLPPARARSKRWVRRFEREAVLGQELRHPNIIRTLAAGKDRGVRFIAMEYVKGETLDKILARRGRLGHAEAGQVVYHALCGLQHLHRYGLVHGDLKPDNLLLGPDPKRPPDCLLGASVKILDVGLGPVQFKDGTAALLETGCGSLASSAAYLAPEEIRDPRRIDIRADIYSLGCVLYHCLSGHPPLSASGTGQVIGRLTEAPLLSDAEVPELLRCVLRQMLAVDPGERFGSPAQAARALEGYLLLGGADEAPIRHER